MADGVRPCRRGFYDFLTRVPSGERSERARSDRVVCRAATARRAERTARVPKEQEMAENNGPSAPSGGLSPGAVAANAPPQPTAPPPPGRRWGPRLGVGDPGWTPFQLCLAMLA